MKTNLPITQTERFLEPGKPIVTKTDLKGRITYANESFVRISGFDRDELIGASHNVVRHPDMPPEAFADLWRTIKAGQPWRGFVKNRAKNGDFYWVEAFVTPITENGRAVGYMSVRNAPSRQDVEAAEALYRKVKEGKASVPATPLATARQAPGRILWGTALATAALAMAGSLAEGWRGSAMAGLAAALVLGLAAWISTQLLGPLGRIGGAIRNLDEGQLATRIAGGSRQTKWLFDQLEAMRIHLRAMFADVLLAAREVDERTSRLDAAVQAMNQASHTQVGNIARVAAAMEEMSVSIDEISGNTELSREAVRNTAHSVERSMAAMDASTASSDKVVAVVDDAKSRILKVNNAISEVSRVTTVINEIAEQTNLLALNAAIEAARAGEQGRGFAVVADEVRKLAERTTASTGEIAQVVQAIIDHAAAAVTTMESASRDVLQSRERIADSGLSLEEVRGATRTAAELADGITEMLQQQATASHEVANSMEAISASVEASHHNVENVGQSAAELRGTSAELHLLVKHLESALS